MKLRYILMILTFLFIVGCAPSIIEESPAQEVDSEVVEESTEEVVEESPAPVAPKEVMISVITRAWDGSDEDVLTIRPLELEEGYQFSGKNCFICREQLFELVEIVSAEEVIVKYDDVLEPFGTDVMEGNLVKVDSSGACFRAETLTLGVDLCLELI